MIDYMAYSDMLKIQVDMCFPFEYGLYKKIGINNMSIVSEIGCGNAYFLNKLRSAFSTPKYFGYDISSELIKKAMLDKGNKGIVLNLGSIEDMREKADVILLRLIMHQIQDRYKFLKQVTERINPNGIIIVVDPLDEKFQIFPALPRFMIRLGSLRNILSPDQASRQISGLLLDEMRTLNFKLFEQEGYFIPSLLPGYKKKYYDYMKATNNMLGYSSKEIIEINAWYSNSSAYAQIGLFIYVFKKVN